jgi:broad specificity phosphatase PhoE
MDDYKELAEAEELRETADDFSKYYRQALAVAIYKARQAGDSELTSKLRQELKNVAFVKLSNIENQKMIIEEYPERIKDLLKDNKRIWLIQHGESVANAGAATQDHVTIALTPTGHEQAREVSLLIPEVPGLIITSPFTRTQLTAKPTLERFPEAIHEVWNDIQEFTYLAPATCINTTAAERHDRVNEYWERLDPDYIDGEGAESFRQFLSRVQAASDRLSRLSNGLTVMFTHAQFIRGMKFWRDNDEQDIG